VVRKLADVSASGACALIGGHPNKSRGAYWDERRGVAKPPNDYQRNMMDNGHRAEPLIADALQRQYFSRLNMKLRTTGCYRRLTPSGRTLVMSSPDRLVETADGALTLLEIKASQPRCPEEAEEEPSIKPYDVPQILAQMWTTGIDCCYYARHNGVNKIAIYYCEFDMMLWQAIADTIDESKQRYMNGTWQRPPRLPAGVRDKWQSAFMEYIEHKCYSRRTIDLIL
jgi:hypothetical protein